MEGLCDKFEGQDIHKRCEQQLKGVGHNSRSADHSFLLYSVNL